MAGVSPLADVPLALVLFLLNSECGVEKKLELFLCPLFFVAWSGLVGKLAALAGLLLDRSVFLSDSAPVALAECFNPVTGGPP